MSRAIKDAETRGKLPPLDQLRERRLALGLTQEALAVRLRKLGMDINRSALSHWEHGRYPMPVNDPASRQILAEALEVSVKELLEIAGFEVEDSHINEIAFRAMQLDDKDQADILQVIRWIQDGKRSEADLPQILDEIDLS